MATNMIAEAEKEAAGQGEYQCPLATRDVKTNLKHRNWAFANVGYGPANPLDEKNNEEFWLRKSIMYVTSLDEAKAMRCGNCSAFIQTSFMHDCITKGIEAKDPADESGYDEDVIESAQLGFCELFHFKCAALRTCDAWLVGGPITDKSDMEDTKD
jgi:hypothetical protein